MADNPGGRARLILLLPAALALGLVIRAAGGAAIFPSAIVYAAGGPESVPGAQTPEDAARSFYLLLASGEYGKAWELALEPDWSNGAEVPYRSDLSPSEALSRWTPESRFVRRLSDELGPGSLLKLNSIQAREVQGEDGASVEPAVRKLIGERKIISVQADGNLVGACTVYHWDRLLPVVRTDTGYKVLLPGTKAAKALFYQSWFANVRQIGALRGSRR